MHLKGREMKIPNNSNSQSQIKGDKAIAIKSDTSAGCQQPEFRMSIFVTRSAVLTVTQTKALLGSVTRI